ncbi:hypothetical protein CKA32_006473 [Geitlerinema sp. FC II]|nr:hypothetical protein CKA32_006473 [Geitlerinema sp. FC II]
MLNFEFVASEFLSLLHSFESLATSFVRLPVKVFFDEELKLFSSFRSCFQTILFSRFGALFEGGVVCLSSRALNQSNKSIRDCQPLWGEFFGFFERQWLE